MEREVKTTISNAVRDALNDPEPPAEELFTDIYDPTTKGCFPILDNNL